MLKLCILDIDGVLTNGEKTYGTDGSVISKNYCDQDFTAIKRLKSCGVNVCFLSGDKNVNEPMAKNRNIDFYYSRGVDKKDFLTKFEHSYNTDRSEMLYIGDDLFDLNIMKLVGLPYCPSDSCADVIDFCNPLGTVLKSKGGCKVISELFSKLLKTKIIKEPNFDEIQKLDSKERF